MNQPILIQGAMEVEVQGIVAAMEEVSHQTIAGFSFWTGQLAGHSVVVSQTGIGTIHAACATTLGIQTYQPKVVINQGIAGAHRPQIHTGDIIVGESCIHISDFITPELGKGAGTHPETWYIHDWRELEEGETYHWMADAQWVARMMDAPYAGGKKLMGRLGSGDIFNREYDRIVQVQAMCGEDCEDMESIAVYQLCKAFGVPCVGVRIISNNELIGESYQPAVASDLQVFLCDLLKTLPAER